MLKTPQSFSLQKAVPALEIGKSWFFFLFGKKILKNFKKRRKKMKS